MNKNQTKEKSSVEAVSCNVEYLHVRVMHESSNFGEQSDSIFK